MPAGAQQSVPASLVIMPLVQETDLGGSTAATSHPVPGEVTEGVDEKHVDSQSFIAIAIFISPYRKLNRITDGSLPNQPLPCYRRSAHGV
jgi:hypothetical protein